MTGRPPRWGAAAFALVVALAGGIVVLVQHFLRDPSSAVDARSAADETADPNGAASSAARGESPSHPDASAIPTPTVTAVEPRLEWPDEASLRKLEQGGRALFGGMVRAPDGTPCPGATVWLDGVVVATTDDRGAWRADVSCANVDEETGFERGPGFDHELVARKEHVGSAFRYVMLPSRRIDLDLATGFSFSGTVVDFDDATPIGGAELEMSENEKEEGDHRVLFATRADELGRFEFPNLREGAVYVRGRAPGYDSNGFFGYDFSKGRDVVVAYRLRRQFKIRGRFVPWPAPGVAIEKATVRATTNSPHDRSNTKREYRGKIGSDGRFELALPVCPVCSLELLVGDEPYWKDELDTNEERREFDVGDVELPAAAALTGRLEIADSELLPRIVVIASVSTADGRSLSPQAHLGADGSFRLAPLPPGVTTLWLGIGRSRIASLHDASGLGGEELASGVVELVAGTTRDVGLVTTRVEVIHGTVRDADGSPVAFVTLNEFLKSQKGERAGPFAAHTDSNGSFFEVRDLSHLDADFVRDVEGHALWSFDGRGHMSQTIEFEWPPSQHFVRHDVVLAAGIMLQGRIVGDSDRPRPEVQIAVISASGEAGVFGQDVTRADGSFEIRGMVAGTYRILAIDQDGAQQFDGIHPENGPVTLRPSDASKQ
ncbi:MAG TPA: carboxypeptidase-like regulatory domain-containing protein [Planctomycetota bacterium]|nr:carboxypeptidase-like regulatory domain-containing protein [Planctomycetota bacterium]